VIDLQGVKRDVLARVSVGQRLAVSIVSSGGYEAVVCTVGKSGAVLGTLAAFPKLSVLISCIKQNNQYVAVIKKIERGGCVVAVSRS
jgi:hypothetical protein